MVSAWPELPFATTAGVCDGQDTLAFSTIIENAPRDAAVQQSGSTNQCAAERPVTPVDQLSRSWAPHSRTRWGSNREMISSTCHNENVPLTCHGSRAMARERLPPRGRATLGQAPVRICVERATFLTVLHPLTPSDLDGAYDARSRLGGRDHDRDHHPRQRSNVAAIGLLWLVDLWLDVRRMKQEDQKIGQSERLG